MLSDFGCLKYCACHLQLMLKFVDFVGCRPPIIFGRGQKHFYIVGQERNGKVLVRAVVRNRVGSKRTGEWGYMGIMDRTFKEMEEMYRQIVKRFSKIELQEWRGEGAMIELSKQVGELAKQVMIKEKYYALEGDVPDVDERLGNEMADVIAQVMRLADHYGIDLEKAFVEAREDEDRYLKSRNM